MSFAELNLHPSLIRSLQAMGYHSPTAIQAQAILPAMEGRDVIGLAPTGTGKTCAFIAPIAQQLIAAPRSTGGGKSADRKRDPAVRLRALVLCPTRELAMQVEAEAATIVRAAKLRTLCVYGTVSMGPQIEALRHGVHILVGTPGRIRDLLEAGELVLSNVRHVAIDEADRMIDMGFRPQVDMILSRVPARRQMLLFTATMPDIVEDLARKYLDTPQRIEVGQHTTTRPDLEERLVLVQDRGKVPWLLNYLKDEQRHGVLIFCRTKRRVGWVGKALQRHSIDVGMIHGDRSQAQRQRALQQFAEGRLQVVVATDVAARGLHIPSVHYVVNYDLPQEPEEYVHRVGRAGHGGGAASAVTLLDPRQQDRWAMIAAVVGIDIEPESASPDEPAGFRSKAATRPPEGRKRVGKRRRRKMRNNDASTQHRDPVTKRGRIKRRGNRRRPIDPSEKPGKGVQSPRRDTNGD